MKLTLAEVCKYGGCTITSKNFTEGEKLLNSDYILKCERLTTEKDSYNVIAYCRRYARVNDELYEIKGNINRAGVVTKFTCSCHADSNKQCKHILAVLLFCNRNDVDKLTVFSPSADESENSCERISDQFKATPIGDIECYKKSYRSIDALVLRDGQKELLEQKIMSFLKKS